ncbi:MAG: UbiA family prenyltransferase [Chitinophagaceae bacterium]
MKSIIQHLRFPFSVLLMPVFLYALFESQANFQNLNSNIYTLFFILHMLVYPSSNAYNSLQDRDLESIGLIKKPLPPSKHLYWITLLFDFLAIAISALYLGILISIGIFIYIVFSRLYSYRKIRLKKYPYVGFLTVFIFQGLWIFILVQLAMGIALKDILLLLAFNASFFIGSMYPLSQIYQHEQDQQDDVITLSYILGYKGTFLFSGMLFFIASSIFLFYHGLHHHLITCIVYSFGQIPVIVYFFYWFYQVEKNNSQADFKHTMFMNIISAVCMISIFSLLIVLKT